jgi:DNA (cytosine-5)-methyltransferase 1
MKNPTPDFLLIDLFCGAGGTTIGAEMSGRCKVIAAINHDPLAIASHAANHRDVLHLTEDILIAKTDLIRSQVAYWKAIYPNARLILWASLECTNFSDAKGGLPRDEDSRSLAQGMFRYLEDLQPDLFLIENVREFMGWGPLIPKVVKCKSGDYCQLYEKKDGTLGPHMIPESRTAGKDYVRWVKRVQSYGYDHDWRILCAADFGGVTIRERYFGAFYRPGQPFAWPQRTHARKPAKGNLFADELRPWRAVAEVLDFSDLGKSIFDRKKPLVDKTLRRILAGLRKFHTQPQVMTCNSPGYCQPVNRPVGTLTTVNSKAMLTPILASYYSGGDNVSSTNKPCGALPTKDKFALVTPWIDRDFRTGGHQPVTDPAGTVMTVPKMNLCTAFLVPSNFDNQPRPIDQPAPTLLASRKHINIASAFIVNPQFHNAGSPIDRPAPTVIAQQRSRPLALATTTDQGAPRWTPADTDTPAMTEIKTYMKAHGIADIYMRMLKVVELKRIQGFPDNYILKGNTNDQKKFIGNSVETGVVRAWINALPSIIYQKQTSAA